MSNQKTKKHVRMIRRNWDIDFYSDMMDGTGFIISEPAEVSLDGTKKKSLYGPDSPLYGTTYSDEQAFVERYRCECGAFHSRQFENEICPICGTKVQERGVNINTTGWITLGMNENTSQINRIINPYYYKKLQKAIGRTVFPDIVKAVNSIDINGKKEKADVEEFDLKPSSPYAYIGIDEFFNKYEEILEYFKSTKKNKADQIDKLLKMKRAVFTSHIPIYSTLLRPQSVTADTFYYESISKIINTLYSLSENIKRCVDVEKDFILYRIQKKVNDMWEMNFSQLNGKEGLIRGELLGGSLNFTSRNVIIPDPTLHDNEVDLSYNTFLELYKYKIIYYIMKLYDTTLGKAHAMWRNAIKFDENVYNIMTYILEHEDPHLVINRNPTLNYYSMLLMSIRSIKRDGNDYCLSVPMAILPGLNADQQRVA